MGLEPDIREDWLTALETEEIPALHSVMRDEGNGRCAMGVLVDLHPDLHWLRDTLSDIATSFLTGGIIGDECKLAAPRYQVIDKGAARRDGLWVTGHNAEWSNVPYSFCLRLGIRHQNVWDISSYNDDDITRTLPEVAAFIRKHDLLR